jgi:hypothetical protein
MQGERSQTRLAWAGSGLQPPGGGRIQVSADPIAGQTVVAGRYCLDDAKVGVLDGDGIILAG